MQKPVQVTFRNLDRSEAIVDIVEEKASKLEHYFDQIISCHVVIEKPHKHQHKGEHFHVRVDIKVPNTEIVTGRDPEQDTRHVDLHSAINDAFEASTRRLKAHVDRLQG